MAQNYNNNKNQQGDKRQNQIIRKDGKDCLLDVNTQSFGIHKVQFVFSKYDMNRPAGSRTTSRIIIYLGFAEALEFAHSVLDQTFSKKLVQAQKTFSETNKPWDKDVVISMGGTPKPKNRTDGKAESRIMKAQLGTKKPVVLIASTGPGDVNEKGLIVPTKGARTEHSVMVTLSAEDIRQIALMVQTHIQSYLAYEHLKGMWQYTPVMGSNQQGDTGYNHQQAPVYNNAGENGNYQANAPMNSYEQPGDIYSQRPGINPTSPAFAPAQPHYSPTAGVPYDDSLPF